MCYYKAKPCAVPGIAGMLSLCCGRAAGEKQHWRCPSPLLSSQAEGVSPPNARSQVQGQLEIVSQHLP